MSKKVRYNKPALVRVAKEEHNETVYQNADIQKGKVKKQEKQQRLAAEKDLRKQIKLPERVTDPQLNEQITQLVDDDINRIINDYNEMGDCSTLAFILDEGFVGYRSYTDEQLMQELEERDISYLFGEDDPTFIDINTTGGKW